MRSDTISRLDPDPDPMLDSGRHDTFDPALIDTLDPRLSLLAPRLLVCVLGPFRIVQADQPIPLHGDKTEALLCGLALHYDSGVRRETLLHLLWPDADPALAAQALHSRLHSLRTLLSGAMSGAAPVVHVDGYYRLNHSAGVGADVACFDVLATSGDHHARAGNTLAAATSYQHAIALYRGDVCVATDAHAVIERERLRARYLYILGTLATYAFAMGNLPQCLAYAQRMLDHDPCREDAHRLIMRCHVRRGERAQALRQYHLCRDILQATFAAAPEPETSALFDQVRLTPHCV